MQLPFLFIYTGGASLHTAHNSSKCEDQQAETSPAMPPCDPLPGSLTFLTSGGLGNQYYGLQIAAWLAIALRRGTLVVPPILRHFKLGSPAGRGCESVDAAAAADGSQREHATRAQQIWLDMERRGVADSWGLLLDFGCSGHGSASSTLPNTVVARRKLAWRSTTAAGLRRAGSSTVISRWRSRRPRRRRYRWVRPSTISTLTR